MNDPAVLSDRCGRGDEVEDDHPRTERLGEVSRHAKGFLRRLIEIRRVYDRLEQLHDVPPSSDLAEVETSIHRLLGLV